MLPEIPCDECGGKTGKFRFDMTVSPAIAKMYRDMGVPKEAPPVICGRCSGLDIT